MSKRTAIIGPLALDTMDALQHGFSEGANLGTSSIWRQRELLFGTMIQAGVDGIEYIEPRATLLPKGESLRERVRSPEKTNPDWERCKTLVEGVFFGVTHPSENLAVVPICEFVTTVLFALHRRKNLITLELPIHSDLEDLSWPPELTIPLHNLMSALSPVESSLPGVRFEVAPADVAIYQDLLADRLFLHYMDASSTLNSLDSDRGKSLEAVEEAARKLTSRNKRLLRLQRAPISLLGLTAKLVDTVFGSLPGKLAELAAESAQSALSGGHRLVIYNFSRIFYQIARAFIETGGRGSGQPRPQPDSTATRHRRLGP